MNSINYTWTVQDVAEFQLQAGQWVTTERTDSVSKTSTQQLNDSHTSTHTQMPISSHNITTILWWSIHPAWIKHHTCSSCFHNTKFNFQSQNTKLNLCTHKKLETASKLETSKYHTQFHNPKLPLDTYASQSEWSSAAAPASVRKEEEEERDGKVQILLDFCKKTKQTNKTRSKSSKTHINSQLAKTQNWAQTREKHTPWSVLESCNMLQFTCWKKSTPKNLDLLLPERF